MNLACSRKIKWLLISKTLNRKRAIILEKLQIDETIWIEAV